MRSRQVYTTALVVLLLLFVLTRPVIGQALPAMIYGGPEDERAYALVEASDTGYVMAGWTKSFGAGAPAFTNVLVVKTDTFGTPQWSEISIGPFDDEAYSMTQTFDGGYALTGLTRSYGWNAPAFSNIFVLKLDNMGNLQWGFAYSEPMAASGSNEEAYSIIQTLDGGYAVTGWTDMFGTHDIFLLRLDSLGAFQWFRLYWFPPDFDDEGYSVWEVTSGEPFTYLIAGRTQLIADPLNFDAFIIPVDLFGNPVPGINASLILGANDDEAYSVLWDGTYAVAAGWTSSFGPGFPSTDAIVWQTNFGVQNIGNAYGWPGDEMVMDDRSLILTADPGYAVSGWTQSVGPGIPNPNFLILKLDPLLNLQWGRVHPSNPGALFEEAHPMIQTKNKNYAIAGWTDSPWPGGPGNEDFHFLVLDSLGDRPVCVIDTMPPREEIVGDTVPFIVDTAGLVEEIMPIIDEVVEYTEICSIIPGMTEVRQELYTGDLEIYASFEYVRLQILKSGRLRVNLYDVSGRHFATLAQGLFEKGTYFFTLPENMSRGVYFIKADFEGIKKSIKLIRVR